jgi:hypothetical protein
MTTLLDRAMEAARGLSPELQDEVARPVLKIADGEGAPVALTAEQRAAIAASRAAAAHEEFATDDDVRAVWAKHNAVIASPRKARAWRSRGTQGAPRLWIAASRLRAPCDDDSPLTHLAPARPLRAAHV